MQPNLEAVGNPSSIQAAGRYLSTAIEEARQTIADLIGAALVTSFSLVAAPKPIITPFVAP